MKSHLHWMFLHCRKPWNQQINESKFFLTKALKIGSKILYYSSSTKKSFKGILYFQNLHWIIINLVTKSEKIQRGLVQVVLKVWSKPSQILWGQNRKPPICRGFYTLLHCSVLLATLQLTLCTLGILSYIP